MNILLDTNMLIWLALDTLPVGAENIILDRTNNIYFSPASLWEIVINRSLGRDDFNLDPVVLHSSLIEHNYTELKITSKHTLMTGTITAIDKDPFDRILLSQAIIEDMSFLTSDKKLSNCPYKNIIYFKKA